MDERLSDGDSELIHQIAVYLAEINYLNISRDFILIYFCQYIDTVRSVALFPL